MNEYADREIHEEGFDFNDTVNNCVKCLIWLFVGIFGIGEPMNLFDNAPGRQNALQIMNIVGFLTFFVAQVLGPYSHFAKHLVVIGAFLIAISFGLFLSLIFA